MVKLTVAELDRFLVAERKEIQALSQVALNLSRITVQPADYSQYILRAASRQLKKRTNCVSCGAPLNLAKCEYCGTRNRD